MKTNNKIFSFLYRSLVILIIALSVYSCKDELDGQTFFTSTALTISQVLEEDPETYSLYEEILHKTGFFNTLKSYGKYTCFVPTNEAVQQYLSDTWNVSSLDELTTPEQIEKLKLLVKFHTISVKYNTDDFNEGKFKDTTYSGDFLTTSFLQGGGIANVQINREATLVQYDIEANNGVIHQIDKVLNAFSDDVPIVKTIEDTGEYTIFVEALKQTGYYDDFSEIYFETGKRKFFTLFIETDDLYNSEGINSFDDLVARFSPDNSDFKSKENDLNRFVAYHAIANFLYITDFPEDQFLTTILENGAIRSRRTDQYLRLNLADEGLETESFTSLDLQRSNFPARNGVYHSVDKIFEIFTPKAQMVFFDPINDQPEVKNGTVVSRGWYNSSNYSEMNWFPDRDERFITDKSKTQLNGNTFGPGASIYWDMKSPTIPAGKYKFLICGTIGSKNGAVQQVIFDGVPIGPALDGGTQPADIGWRLMPDYSPESVALLTAEMDPFGWMPGVEPTAEDPEKAMDSNGLTAFQNGTYCRLILSRELLLPIQSRHDIRLQTISGTAVQIDYFQFIPVED